jgi:hypothetical protein
MLGKQSQDMSMIYDIPEEILVLILPLCEDIEMLEEILGIGKDKPSNFLTTKFKSKL